MKNATHTHASIPIEVPIVPSGAVELLMFQEPGAEPRLADAAVLTAAVEALRTPRRRLRRLRGQVTLKLTGARGWRKGARETLEIFIYGTVYTCLNVCLMLYV